MESWQCLGKEELGHQYSPSRFNNRNLTAEETINMHVKTVTQASEKAKQKISCELAVSYGPREKQKLDIFAATDHYGPVLLYVHGGYWQELSRELSSFMVEPLVAAKASVICLGYELAPQASMEEIISQVAEGVTYACNWARTRQSSGVYLCGHSAGGHLVTIILTKLQQHSLDMIKGVFPVSGVFDLRPLVNTYVNDPIKMSIDLGWQCSPMKHIPRLAQIFQNNNIKLVVAYGQSDPPSFITQSQSFSQALQKAGVEVACLEVAGQDHFTIIENLAQSTYLLSKKLLNLMNLQ